LGTSHLLLVSGSSPVFRRHDLVVRGERGQGEKEYRAMLIKFNASVLSDNSTATTTTTTTSSSSSSSSVNSSSNSSVPVMSTSTPDLLDLYMGYKDPALSSSCQSKFSEWAFATANNTHTVTRTLVSSQFTPTTLSDSKVTSLQTGVSLLTTTYTISNNIAPTDFDFRDYFNFYFGAASPPCVSLKPNYPAFHSFCSHLPLTTRQCSSCTMVGQTVDLFFWPTPAPSPPVSALVNSDGYTL
jgi:hypothetical protein